MGASEINDDMKLACIDALAELARATSSAEAAEAYRGEIMSFGPEYLIPKPFDPRLMGVVASAVARAAMDSGVATRPVKNFDAYQESLDNSVSKSALVMRPVFDAAAIQSRRVVFAEGESERVLRAASAVLEETTDRPILIGRKEAIIRRISKAGLSIKPGQDFELVDPQNDSRYRDYWTTYLSIMQRKGVTPELARRIMRTNTTAIASVMVYRGEADSLICGTFGQYRWHLNFIEDVLGKGKLSPIAALSLMILEDGPLFIADTNVHSEPSPSEIAKTVIASARHARRFGIEPKIALCSHSQFGNLDCDTGRRMRSALEILDSKQRDFIYEGEMHTDSALDETLRQRIFPESRFSGEANVLIFANTDAASAVRNILKIKADGAEVGPILMGMGNRAHIVNPSITARGLLNISVLAGTPVSELSLIHISEPTRPY